MVFVCNLRDIDSLTNVVILFAIKTCQPCHYIKPIARVYTRECHENKTTRFWATYDTISHRTLTRPITMQVNNFEIKTTCHLVVKWCTATLKVT